MPTYPQLKTKKLKKEDAIAQIVNIKIANYCSSPTNSPK